MTPNLEYKTKFQLIQHCQELEAKIEFLESNGSKLAAGQCIKELKGDEWGHLYCTADNLAQENNRMKETLQTIISLEADTSTTNRTAKAYRLGKQTCIEIAKAGLNPPKDYHTIFDLAEMPSMEGAPPKHKLCRWALVDRVSDSVICYFASHSQAQWWAGRFEDTYAEKVRVEAVENLPEES